MKTIRFGETAVSAQGSPWALFVYEREFSNPGRRASWHEDYVAWANALPDIDEGMTAEGYADYMAAMEPTFLLKTAWAMAKNADDAVPPFEEWARSLEAPLHPWAPWKWEVHAAMNAELFLLGGQEAEQEKR